MGFKSSEYGWKDLSIVLLGRPITGFREITYSEDRPVDLIEASGDEAHSVTKGMKKFKGSIELLQSEVIALENAAKDSINRNASITDLLFDITVAYVPKVGNLPVVGALIRVDILKNCSITGWEKSLKAGDPNMNIKCNLVIGSVQNGA